MAVSPETEIINRIGVVLREVLPDGFESITASEEATDDWASLDLEFRNKADETDSFGIDDEPQGATSEILGEVIRLNELMAGQYGGGRRHYRFTVTRAGEVEADFRAGAE